jgi:hypothetical protein
MRRMLFSLALGFALASTTIVSAADEKPDATVSFEGGSVAVGIGYSWGSGTLHYKGEKHALKVDGLSVGDVGATEVSATGKVYNLKKLSDFPGTYPAVSAGAAAGGGGGVSEMVNQNGVRMRVESTTQGVKFKLGVDGIKISLKE